MTFEDDKLGLKPFSLKLKNYLMVEHEFVEGSLVVSLNAPFGSGKSTFLAMWKADLEAQRRSDPACPKVIVLNAWESDYCGDPFLSVMAGLIKATDDGEPQADPSKREDLREAAKDVAWFGIGLLNGLASHLSGLDSVAAAELATSKKQQRSIEKTDFIALYERRTEALQKLKTTLNSVYGGDVPKAFIFVDELDRCRPDYAISYLETIKHVFDVHGLVFVLAIDYDQLACSAKALFGQELNFSEYFRKFSNRRLTLQEPDEQAHRNLIHYYANRYLEIEGKRLSMLDPGKARSYIFTLIIGLRLTLRQTQEVFRIVGHVLAGEPERRKSLYWAHGAGVILMASLKVANRVEYHSMSNGQTQDYIKIGRFLLSLFNLRDAEWWFSIYATGSWPAEEQTSGNLGVALKELGFVSRNADFDAQSYLKEFTRGWGGQNDLWLQKIVKFIESATRYEEA